MLHCNSTAIWFHFFPQEALIYLKRPLKVTYILFFHLVKHLSMLLVGCNTLLVYFYYWPPEDKVGLR